MITLSIVVRHLIRYREDSLRSRAAVVVRGILGNAYNLNLDQWLACARCSRNLSDVRKVNE
jgi:hypothetical protein